MINFKNTYYNELSEENKKELDLFSKEKCKFSEKLKKIFYFRRLRRKFAEDLMLRIIFIIGGL